MSAHSGAGPDGTPVDPRSPRPSESVEEAVLAPSFRRDPLELALAAGLELAVRQFPADVIAASEGAEKARAAMTESVPRTSEPWPPMRVPISR